MSSAGSSSDANPPPLYSGMPPSAFRGGVPSLYPQSAGFGSWGPPPPTPQQAGTGTSLATPMYWQGYYGVPSGHLTQQPQLQPMMPPPGLGGTPSGPYTATEPLAAPSVSAASIPSAVAPVSLTPPTTSALQPPVAVTLAVSSTSTSTAVSTVASPLPVPVSAPTSVTSSIQGGVSAVITPTAKNPRRVVGIYQSAHPSVQQAERGSSQGPTLSLPSSDALSTADATLSQAATTQLPRVLGPPMKAQVSNSQPPLTADQSGSEPAKLASQSIESTPAQPPQQQQVTQPLLPLPSSQHKHQPPQVFHFTIFCLTFLCMADMSSKQRFKDKLTSISELLMLARNSVALACTYELATQNNVGISCSFGPTNSNPVYKKYGNCSELFHSGTSSRMEAMVQQGDNVVDGR